MTSKAIVRSAEDIDEKALSYAEIKALAAGNPLIIEKTELDTQVARLKLLKQNYLSEIYKLEDLIAKYYPVEIKKTEEMIIAIEKDIKVIEENTNIDNPDKFSPMILRSVLATSKKETAGKELLEICKNKQTAEQEEIGSYRDLKMFLQIDTIQNTFQLKLKGEHTYTVNLGTDVYGNLTRIDNVIADIPKLLEKTKTILEERKQQFEIAKRDVKIPFDKEDELKEKSNRLDKVNILLNLNEKDDEIIEENEIEVEDEENKNQDFDKEPIR